MAKNSCNAEKDQQLSTDFCKRGGQSFMQVQKTIAAAERRQSRAARRIGAQLSNASFSRLGLRVSEPGEYNWQGVGILQCQCRALPFTQMLQAMLIRPRGKYTETC